MNDCRECEHSVAGLTMDIKAARPFCKLALAEHLDEFEEKMAKANMAQETVKCSAVKCQAQFRKRELPKEVGYLERVVSYIRKKWRGENGEEP